MRETRFVDVILPLALPKLYTYRVPFECNDEVAIGKRVLVNFGASKIYSGLIGKIHGNPPEAYQAKYIEAVIDEYPVVTDLQLKFWDWICDYYLCYAGELLLASLPASLRLASETIVVPIDAGIGVYDKLTDAERVVFDALIENNRMALADIADLLQRKSVYPLVKSMLEKQVVGIEEEVHDRYKVLTKPFVSLAENFKSDAQLNEAFDLLKRAPKQQDALMKVLQLLGGNHQAKIPKSTIISADDSLNAAISSLQKRGILNIEYIPVDRVKGNEADGKVLNLSVAQNGALESIKEGFEQDKVTLLHGVTGSGKTEIYIRLIEETLKKGKQVLYLVPEIALTGQLTGRLEAYFGKQLRVYHSKFSNNERAEIWYKLLDGTEVKLVVGARSAMLMPFSNLGLVIVDEEHDGSYKQQNPAPRYQARDSAIMLAKMHNAKVLLGSATPAIESYFNAKKSKFHYVPLLERFGKAVLPNIELVDLKKATRDQQIQGEFSDRLLDAISDTINGGEQVILFQNRRGFSPRWLCTTCGWCPECKNCDITLTYHKYKHNLRCHYCGYLLNPPPKCLACGSPSLKMIGFGTEKIEEDLSMLLKDARVGRMDYDSTRGKNAYQQIIHDFETNKINVLVGTQMVTKGLDFDRVGLVGILSADQMLSFPDFRSNERSYQLMMQVAGRAGRREKPGKVLIQTYNTEHWLLQAIVNGNQDLVYQKETQDRREFLYPPYCRIVNITASHIDKHTVEGAAKELAKQLRVFLGARVLGPEYPPIARVRNKYRMEILVKLDGKVDLVKAKALIQSKSEELKLIKAFKSVRVILDVDPY
ncbi:replication restart helicase PriA [Luteibaculum oceani]|nr:primosomal protein N' [Luteibaculum oceani]